MLTSRARVLAAVADREPDQAPIDPGGHRSSDIVARVPPEPIVVTLDTVNSAN